MSIKIQVRKKYDHPYRDKMIEKLCIEVYKIKPENMTDKLKETFSLSCYKEIIKPLIYIDKNILTEGEMQIKYQLTRQEIRTIIFAAAHNIKIHG